MLNSAVFNSAGKSQIMRFIYHKLDILYFESTSVISTTLKTTVIAALLKI